MHHFLIYLCTGILVGAVDALPLWIKKEPKEKSISAFIQYIVITLAIFYSNVDILPWWIQGSTIALAISLPLMIRTAKTEKATLPLTIGNAIILGTSVSIIKTFLF